MRETTKGGDIESVVAKLRIALKGFNKFIKDNFQMPDNEKQQTVSNRIGEDDLAAVQTDLVGTINDLKSFAHGSRAIALAVTKLEEAKHWLDEEANS